MMAWRKIKRKDAAVLLSQLWENNAPFPGLQSFFFPPSVLFKCVATIITFFFLYSSQNDKSVTDSIFIICRSQENRKEKQAKESSYVFNSHTALDSSRQIFLYCSARWEPALVLEMIGSWVWQVYVQDILHHYGRRTGSLLLGIGSPKMHFNVFYCFKLIISWPFSCFLWPFVGALTPGCSPLHYILLYNGYANSEFQISIWENISELFSSLLIFFSRHCVKKNMNLLFTRYIVSTWKYQLIKGELILKTVSHGVMVLWPSDIWLHFLWNPCIFAKEGSLAKD